MPIDNFITVTKDKGASIVAMSTLMTPTMDGMKQVIDGLVEAVDANFRRQAMVEVAASCRVEHAVAGSDAGAVGSALLARTGTLV